MKITGTLRVRPHRHTPGTHFSHRPHSETETYVVSPRAAEEPARPREVLSPSQSLVGEEMILTPQTRHHALRGGPLWTISPGIPD